MPLRQPLATAGIHPAAPVRLFSQRTVYTSARARKRSANSASLSPVGEAIVTRPGVATGAAWIYAYRHEAAGRPR
jgi:hypothetical protein